VRPAELHSAVTKSKTAQRTRCSGFQTRWARRPQVYVLASWRQSCNVTVHTFPNLTTNPPQDPDRVAMANMLVVFFEWSRAKAGEPFFSAPMFSAGFLEFF
jgi:hypothetical protein